MNKPILLYPNTILRDVSAPVPTDPDYLLGPEFRSLVTDLFETMYQGGGVGLAAIQIGVPLRVFVMDKTGAQAKAPQVFINPEIVELIDESVEMDEGCLSFPGVLEKVKRHTEVIVKSVNPQDGETKTWQLTALEAQIAQHEIEHLDGDLFLNPTSVVARDILKRKIQKYVRLRARYEANKR